MGDAGRCSCRSAGGLGRGLALVVRGARPLAPASRRDTLRQALLVALAVDLLPGVPAVPWLAPEKVLPRGLVPEVPV